MKRTSLLSHPILFLLVATPLLFQEVRAQGQSVREFAPGVFESTAQLPPGRFRQQLEGLPANARRKAIDRLREIGFPASDVADMHADATGGICYACTFGGRHPAGEETDATAGASQEPNIAQASVPVSPFPDGLKFHSKPGLTKILYLNFVGQTVTGTAWNSSNGVTTYNALPFSTDTDYANFSDSEQAAIKQVWQRVAEDYAPFDIDVTTERPATITNTTAIALITRNTDANNVNNPSSTAGGVAYVNAFGRTDFISTYSPAWIYQNNLGNNAANIAEAASHEIGHNMGLSHDGTSSQTYYQGHPANDSVAISDPISWGPLMGTGYFRNVSQWSKGEYLNANNTQDDLAIIAGKVGYRGDDHGGTPGTARPLVVVGGTSVSATTLENDPANTNTANKGVLERNTDVDVFSFTSGAGTITLNINPWIQPSGTRGGNLDILAELYNQSGALVASSNPATNTTAQINVTVSPGVYYLYVKNSGAGDPLASPPSGYTSYGSIGQYFISGMVVDPGVLVVPPVAESQPGDVTQSGLSSHQFAVTYSDNLAINVATLGTGDIRVTGPGNYNQLATFVSVDLATNGTPRVATYRVTPPGGGNWTALNNGTYTVSMEANQVQDTESAAVSSGVLGSFDVAIASSIYAANMTANPGWTLDSPWSYGQPNYRNGGPSSGYSGSNVIGHSMSTDYAKGLALSYATTPLIQNAGAASSLTLSFRRWLGLKKGDLAILQVSGDNGVNWVNLWSTTAAVNDGAWQLVQYPLPQSVIGSSQIRFRWGLSSQNSSGNSPTNIGWHIDDVELLGGGALDALPPSAAMSVANVNESGAFPHSCTITYTDASKVLRSSIDISDVVVVGPQGASSPLQVSSVGVDLPGDGSPMGATYSIDPPGGAWDATDNGSYSITLQEGAVADLAGNTTAETLLGTFTVNISTLTPGNLVVTPAGNLNASGNFGGPFSPSSIQYTLTNSGQASLNWSAGKSAAWVSLSSTGASLAGGASVNVTVSVNATANSLGVGSYGDTIAFSNLTNNNGNTTRTVSLTVNPAPATVTIDSASLSQTYNGTGKSVIVTTNPVGLPCLVTYNGSTNLPVNAATYTVVATIMNPNYAGSASGSLVIGKASQSITFPAPGPATVGQPPFNLAATASSGLSVSYTSSDPTVATVSGNTVTILTAGTTALTALQAGNTNYNPAVNVLQTLTVSPAASGYEAWSNSDFGNDFLDTAPKSNPDGDCLDNLQEFAFGTDPTIPSPGRISFVPGGGVNKPGLPFLMDFNPAPDTAEYRAVFGRRKDHAAVGLRYAVEFSADLLRWSTTGVAPTVLTSPGASGDIEAVSVPFPPEVPVTDRGSPLPPKFFRLGVSKD